MVRVKICGLRSLKDIEIVNRYKPDYAGFVFAEGKRTVNILEAVELCNSLDNSIFRAGVFVNQDVGFVIDAAKKCRLDVIQLHGDESSAYINNLERELLQAGKKASIWKAFRLRDEISVRDVNNYTFSGRILVDSYNMKSYGGTGTRIDIGLVKGIKKEGIILAGGLNVQNISDILYELNDRLPYAVDVSSGVECVNGKDEKAVCEFIDKVRGMQI